MDQNNDNDDYGWKVVIYKKYKPPSGSLRIKALQVSNERKQNALNIYDRWRNGHATFHLYYSQNKILNCINMSLMNKKTKFGKNCKVYDLKETNYLEVLNTIYKNAKNGGAYSGAMDNIEKAVWKTLIGITELEYQLEELKNKSYRDNYIKNFMNKHKWYFFKTDFNFNFIWDVGIIILYPDNKTFSLLAATDMD
jgi:Family of unknown function (DUF6183)